MPTIKIIKDENFTTIGNFHLREKGMSLKAKGLLTLMLSLPQDWDYTTEGLATLSADGRDSIRATLKELEEFHYLYRARKRDDKGMLKGADYYIFEKKEDYEEFIANLTKNGNSEVEIPMTENPSLEQVQYLCGDRPMTENPSLDNCHTDSPMTDFPTLDNPTLGNPTQINTNINKYTNITNNLVKEKEINKEKESQLEEVMTRNNDLDFLEEKFNRPLSSKEMDFFFNNFDWDKEMLLKAVELAKEQNKLCLAYVKGILANWQTNGIDSPDKYEESLKQINQPQRKQRRVEVVPTYHQTDDDIQYTREEVMKMIEDNLQKLKKQKADFGKNVEEQGSVFDPSDPTACGL